MAYTDTCKRLPLLYMLVPPLPLRRLHYVHPLIIILQAGRCSLLSLSKEEQLLLVSRPVRVRRKLLPSCLALARRFLHGKHHGHMTLWADV